MPFLYPDALSETETGFGIRTLHKKTRTLPSTYKQQTDVRLALVASLQQDSLSGSRSTISNPSKGHTAPSVLKKINFDSDIVKSKTKTEEPKEDQG